jgi:hypothetical protein
MKTLESTSVLMHQASKKILTPIFPRPSSKQRAIAAGITCPRLTDLSKRTTEEVFLDHLELRKFGRLEQDIKRNYDEHVLIVSNVGTFYGHDGVRHSAHLLRLLLPTIKYKFDTLLIRGQIAFEEWEAEASRVEVHHGIDAFVISDGKIKVQTIWYESRPRKKGATRNSRARSNGG